MKSGLVISGLVVMVVAAGCGGTGTPPPSDVVDGWRQPPVGVDLDSDGICRENRHLSEYDNYR